MQDAEIYRDLAEVFADVFGREDIVLTPALTAADVEGWDSYRQIELILALEARYGIKFKTRELDGLQNVGDLARTVMTKVNA